MWNFCAEKHNKEIKDSLKSFMAGRAYDISDHTA
jgi:hypothetical protein